MRSAGNPVVGGWLDDALRAISPVYSAIDAVRDAASKKDAAKNAPTAKAADAPKVPSESALAKPQGATVPTWVWFALFYLIARKA